MSSSNNGGFLYAIGAEGTGLVKIGSTHASVEKRLKELQTGQPFVLQVLAHITIETGVRQIEGYVHRFLAQERRRGELRR
jgi:hypothetical protein